MDHRQNFEMVGAKAKKKENLRIAAIKA